MDIKTKLIKDINEYLLTYPYEAEKVKLLIEFIDNNDDLFSRNNKEGHITCSAWIVNADYSKTLLNYHKTMGKWVQTGGHIDEGETPFEGASREAYEESGLNNLTPLSNKIFKIGVFTFPAGKDGKEHIHYDLRYLFVSTEESYVVSDESIDLKWVDMVDLKKYSDEENILSMKRRLEEFLTNIL